MHGWRAGNERELLKFPSSIFNQTPTGRRHTYGLTMQWTTPARADSKKWQAMWEDGARLMVRVEEQRSVTVHIVPTCARVSRHAGPSNAAPLN